MKHERIKWRICFTFTHSQQKPAVVQFGYHNTRQIKSHPPLNLKMGSRNVDPVSNKNTLISEFPPSMIQSLVG